MGRFLFFLDKKQRKTTIKLLFDGFKIRNFLGHLVNLR